MAGGVAIVREDFSPLVVQTAAGFNALFDETMDELPAEEFSTIFSIETSKGAYETEIGLVGFGGPALKAELEPYRYDKPRMGRNVTYIMNGYGLAVAISREAIDDDRSGRIVKVLAPELARNFRLEREYQASDIFNNAFTVQGYEPEKAPNARPLVANNHLLIRPSTYGSTNSNAVGGALSITTLAAARALGRKNLTESGKKSPITYQYLVVGPSMETQAEIILRSTMAPGQYPGGTQPNDQNIFGPSGTYKLILIVWDYLQDDGRWFLVTKKAGHRLKWFDRQVMTPDQDYDKNIRAMKYMMYARWARGFSDYRGVLGSVGS